MRFFALFFGSALLLHADNFYEVQIYAAKQYDHHGVSKLLEKSKKAGLTCELSSQLRGDHQYYVVRCDKQSDIKGAKKSLKKAKFAKMDGFIVPSQESSPIVQLKKATVVEVSQAESKPTPVSTPLLHEGLFGENEGLRRLLLGENRPSQAYLEEKKRNYLNDVEKEAAFNGFSLKGSSANNFDTDKHDYSTRLEWDMFEGGYFGTKEEAKRKRLKRESVYDTLMGEVDRYNFELSMYELSATQNQVNYTFLKKQEALLEAQSSRAKNELDASLITALEYYETKKNAAQIKNLSSYYASLERKPFDAQLQSLITSIEKAPLIDKETLLKSAYENNHEIKNALHGLDVSQMEDKTVWETIKTSLYVENKKPYFLDNTDVIGGVSVEIPLDSNAYQKGNAKTVETQVAQSKLEAVKMHLKQEIEERYRKISFNQTSIKSLDEDRAYLKKTLESYQQESKNPIDTKEDLRSKMVSAELYIAQIDQKIWLLRNEILKDIVELQYLSHARVLDGAL